MNLAGYPRLIDTVELLSTPMKEIINLRQGNLFLRSKPTNTMYEDKFTYCQSEHTRQNCHWSGFKVKEHPEASVTIRIRGVVPYDINGVPRAITDMSVTGS